MEVQECSDEQFCCAEPLFVIIPCWQEIHSASHNVVEQGGHVSQPPRELALQESTSPIRLPVKVQPPMAKDCLEERSSWA